MASLKERVARASRAPWPSATRDRPPGPDAGALRAGEGESAGGAVTCFGFFSFFPILALAFFVIGYVAQLYPGARDDLVSAIEAVLPGIIGNGTGQLSIDDFESSAGAARMLGLVGLLVSGLGWLSDLRDALTVVFELPPREQPNFVVGEVRDLVTLVVVGLGAWCWPSPSRASWRGSRPTCSTGSASTPSWPGWSSCSASCSGWRPTRCSLVALFRLLAEPAIAARSLWSGALLGAIGFEVLKQLSGCCSLHPRSARRGGSGSR